MGGGIGREAVSGGAVLGGTTVWFGMVLDSFSEIFLAW